MTGQQNGIATRTSFNANCRTSRPSQRILPTFSLSRIPNVGTRTRRARIRPVDATPRRDPEINRDGGRHQPLRQRKRRRRANLTSARYYRVCLVKSVVSVASRLLIGELTLAEVRNPCLFWMVCSIYDARIETDAILLSHCQATCPPPYASIL